VKFRRATNLSAQTEWDSILKLLGKAFGDRQPLALFVQPRSISIAQIAFRASRARHFSRMFKRVFKRTSNGSGSVE
jgi:hypothetical protein